MIICSSALLRMTNFAVKPCIENRNTDFYVRKLFYNNRVVYWIKWKNMAEPERPEMAT